MQRSLGAWISSAASAVLIVILVAAFVPESPFDIILYYGFNTVNPLFAGVFALGVIAVFASIRSGRLSESVGAGIALGLGLISFATVLIWAFTGRVDVFLARGWIFPAQRWILTGVAVVIVFGAGLYAWSLQLFTSGRS